MPFTLPEAAYVRQEGRGWHEQTRTQGNGLWPKPAETDGGEGSTCQEMAGMRGENTSHSSKASYLLIQFNGNHSYCPKLGQE